MLTHFLLDAPRLVHLRRLDVNLHLGLLEAVLDVGAAGAVVAALVLTFFIVVRFLLALFLLSFALLVLLPL